MTISMNYNRENCSANERRKIEIMSLLIKHGSDVNIRKPGIGIGYGYKSSMLHVACNILDNTVKIVRLLLDNGIRADVMNDHDQTPLHFASERMNYGIMSILIEFGANVNARDKNNDTPITLLMQSGFGEFYMMNSDMKMRQIVKCIKLLTRNGAKINDVGSLGATPLFMAVHGLLSGCNVNESRDLIDVLINFRANLNIGLMVGSDDSYLDYYCIGDTPLHAAVKLRNLTVVNYLFTFYPNMNRVNSRNMSVLDYARTYKDKTIYKKLKGWKKIELKCHKDDPNSLS
jgi:cytohesin